MLVRDDQEFRLYRRGVTVGPLGLGMFYPFVGTPVLLISELSYYLVTKVGRWHHDNLIEMEVAAKFTDRDIAILAYKLLGGA